MYLVLRLWPLRQTNTFVINARNGQHYNYSSPILKSNFRPNPLSATSLSCSIKIHFNIRLSICDDISEYFSLSTRVSTQFQYIGNFPNACLVSRHFQPSRFNTPKNMQWKLQIIKLLSMQFFSVLFVTSLSYVQILSSAVFFLGQASQIYVLPWG